jgi:hypothetical protein
VLLRWVALNITGLFGVGDSAGGSHAWSVGLGGGSRPDIVGIGLLVGSSDVGEGVTEGLADESSWPTALVEGPDALARESKNNTTNESATPDIARTGRFMKARYAPSPAKMVDATASTKVIGVIPNVLVETATPKTVAAIDLDTMGHWPGAQPTASVARNARTAYLILVWCTW